MKMPDKIKKQLEVLKDTINNDVEKGAGEEMKDLAPSGMGWYTILSCRVLDEESGYTGRHMATFSFAHNVSDTL